MIEAGEAVELAFSSHVVERVDFERPRSVLERRWCCNRFVCVFYVRPAGKQQVGAQRPRGKPVRSSDVLSVDFCMVADLSR